VNDNQLNHRFPETYHFLAASPLRAKANFTCFSLRQTGGSNNKSMISLPNSCRGYARAMLALIHLSEYR